MAIDFNNLIPTPTAVKEKKPKKEPLSYGDLIERKIAPSARAMSFEDLVPRESRVAFPKVDPAMLKAAKRVMGGERVPEETIPSIQKEQLSPVPKPTAEDLDTYRRMGLKQYTSPSGKIYPLTKGKVYPPPTEYLRTKEVPEVLGEIAKAPKPIHYGTLFGGRPVEDLSKEISDKLGVPEIFKGIREMIAPTTEYTREEAARQIKETPEKILWSLKYIPTLGGRLGGKDFRKRLLEQAEEFAGFGPALGPASGEISVLALEWGLIYPALFKAVGMSGKAISKIPRVAKATEAIKKMGGFGKLAKAHPRAFARAANITKAIGKGAGAGGVMAGAEVLGKDMEPGEVIKHVGKRAALMAGVAGTFQAASEVDTAIYTRRLRNALVRASNSRFAVKLREVDAMPISTVKSAAYSSLTSLKKAEMQAIDKIVSSAEAQLLGLKEGKLYQLGQEVVESPQRAAERMIRYGLEPGRPLPKGVKALKAGLGKTKPFIEMPMTKVAETIETSREIGQMLKHPSRIAKRIAERVKIPKPPAKIAPRPITAPPEPVERVPEAEKPPTEKVREPTEHLIALPKAKGAREIEPAKGETILIENPEQKGNYQKYEDFGTGILRKGNKLYHKASLKEIEKFSTVKNARKAAQTLAQEDIDFELEDVEKIKAQFQEWRTEKGDIDIEAYLIGKGKELQGEDYPEIIRTMAWVREKDTIIKKLKNFVSEVPEFTLFPVLTYKEGYLVFSDGYRFKFVPDYFGINKESLAEGDKIRFDLESLGIKRPSAKKLKAAEIWTGEPKIMGRVAEKPIPVERLGLERKPRKLTAKEEVYERALVDIEIGKRVEVPGGVTYKAVREDDIRRVAELGRKAGRQAWTVERDILGRQERGTAETKMDIGDAIKIIRDVFSAAEPSGQAKTEPAKMPEHQRTPKGLIVVESDIGEVHILEGALTGEYGKDLETIFYYGNFQSETPQPRLKRSLSVGDTVKYRDHTLMVMPQGWRDITGLSDDAIEAIQTSENAIGLAASWRAAEKRLRKEKEGETEEPSEFVPPAKPKLFFDDLIPRPADVKHIKNVVVDTFREWPQSIKRVGKDFYVEVMAVAKQLATPYRYKALRQTMLGVFRHKKRPAPEVVGIEVQDITDALTATHELGHNIDWLLNNKIFPSSIKARFPNATTGEFSLRNELKKISQVLRPDMWERPKAYIKSHVELMADFISHYILDPEKTRELAPNITRAFEAKLSTKPDMFEIISRLQESRYAGEEPAVAKHIREEFPVLKEFTPLKLAVDMMDKDYVKAAEELGITAARHYKLLIARAEMEARRIDKLVPNKDRQTDLVVVAENGSKNPWTGKTFQEILKEGITANEQKAINLFRAYQEKARQTVNKYLRGADIAEYIKFIEDYFIHAYQTPLTAKYKVAIARWAKRSPQAKKRVLPDLAKAVELGMKPRAKTLSEGLRLWNGINVRVMTNKAFLRILPNITNDDGVSILQKPQDYPYWPTVDYWPIRQTYAVPLPNRGILLFQGRVAVDPRVKPFIDAMFGRKVFNTPVRVIEGLNATWKAFELTLLSAFHHVEEFFSAVGSLGPRALPFVGGYYGKRAQVFGKKKLFGFLPEHIGVLKAGKELEKVPEFMEDYIAHGGQRGYISTEGINLMERMFKSVEDYLKNIIQTKPISGKAVWLPYVPAKGARATYSWMQHLLWDNVNRAKLVTYYQIVADGAKNSNLPIKEVKELAVEYVNDNFGGQEWLNSMFRNPKTRQFWTQLMMSLDWTWSQIKTARWPLGIGGGNTARRAFMRKIGRHHWFWYLAAMAGFTIAGSYAFTGKGPWENEKGHKLNVDWTKIWRSLPWNRDWKERGDYARRYMSLGKAGRELVRWVTSPLRAFGYKLSPVARSTFEQTTGYNVGSDWAEPWARDDLELYQEVYARFKHLMDNFKPFSLSGNNAFLAFPSKKGMTQWKAIRSFEELFDVRANIACGGLRAKLTKASHILDRNRKKLVEEIDQSCVLNNVDTAEAMRAAWSNVKTKYYGRFWYSAKQQDADKCDRYADALLALGVTEEGFIQSLTTRGRQLSKEAVKIGIERFIERQKQKGTMVK